MENNEGELKLEIEELSKQVSSVADCICKLLDKCEVGSSDYEKVLSVLLNLNKIFSLINFVENEFTKKNSQVLS